MSTDADRPDIKSLLVSAGQLIVAAEQDGTVHTVSDGAVLIRGGAVADLGPASRLLLENPDAVNLGGQQFIALPGLINAHHHIGVTPTQLGIPSESLELWTLMLTQARPVDPYLDTLVAGLEMLRSGVTTVQHLASVRDWPADAASDDAVLRAYSDLGIRVSYSVGVVDQNRFFHDHEDAVVAGLPAPDNTRIAEWLARRPRAAEQLRSGYYDLRSRWQGAASDRIRIQLAPTNLHWCSDEALLLVAQASEDDAVPMHMHLLETPYQRAYGFRRSPRGAIGHLADLGVLSPRLTIGHGVHVDEHDLDVVAAHGVSICHNPSSNLRLKSGVAPINSYLERGIPVAIGIDEAGLSDDRDMLLEMKLAFNLHRTPGIGTRVPTAGEVLGMATSNGAATTPFAGEVGALMPGAQADLVLINRDLLAGAYLSERVPVADAVVHRARPHHVQTVIVNGEVVVDRGAVLTVSEDEVFAEIADRMSLPWSGQAEADRLAGVLLAAARDLYPSWLT